MRGGRVEKGYEMKFYAEAGARRSRQLTGDLLLLAWCVLWVLVGMWVTHSFTRAEDGAHQIETGGASLSSNLGEAGTFVSQIPLAGGAFKAPFDRAATAAASVGSAGHDLSGGLHQLALLLGTLTAVVPIVLAVLPWMFVRMRFARRAGRVAALRRMPGGLRLLALEGLTLATPRQLGAISPDPVGDWQAGNVEVTRSLAEVALASQGLRGAVLAGE